jgi:ureidoacrylate peracid hydrolase
MNDVDLEGHRPAKFMEREQLVTTPEQTAVIVVDVQRLFTDMVPFPLTPALDEVLRRMNLFLAEARHRGVPVVRLRTVLAPEDHSVNTLLWPDEMRAQFLPGAPGTHDDPAVPTEEGDLEVIKTRYSGFVGTQLDSILKSLGVETTVICGLTTNVCVQSTVRDSWQYGYRTVTLSDCCSESNGGPFPLVSHEAALQSIARNFGIICSSQDVVEAWDQSMVERSMPSVQA